MKTNFKLIISIIVMILLPLLQACRPHIGKNTSFELQIYFQANSFEIGEIEPLEAQLYFYEDEDRRAVQAFQSSYSNIGIEPVEKNGVNQYLYTYILYSCTNINQQFFKAEHGLSKGRVDIAKINKVGIRLLGNSYETDLSEWDLLNTTKHLPQGCLAQLEFEDIHLLGEAAENVLVVYENMLIKKEETNTYSLECLADE